MRTENWELRVESKRAESWELKTKRFKIEDGRIKGGEKRDERWEIRELFSAKDYY